jgi:hypothetical protein
VEAAGIELSGIWFEARYSNNNQDSSKRNSRHFNDLFHEIRHNTIAKGRAKGQKKSTSFTDALFFNKNGGLGPQSRLPTHGFSDLKFALIKFEVF